MADALVEKKAAKTVETTAATLAERRVDEKAAMSVVAKVAASAYDSA